MKCNYFKKAGWALIEKHLKITKSGKVKNAFTSEFLLFVNMSADCPASRTELEVLGKMTKNEVCILGFLEIEKHEKSVKIM